MGMLNGDLVCEFCMGFCVGILTGDYNREFKWGF